MYAFVANAISFLLGLFVHHIAVSVLDWSLTVSKVELQDVLIDTDGI